MKQINGFGASLHARNRNDTNSQHALPGAEFRLTR
jgi:hypothetical protein